MTRLALVLLLCAPAVGAQALIDFGAVGGITCSDICGTLPSGFACELDIDADSGDLTTDANGVSTWPDQHGSDDLTQTVNADKPDLITSCQNSKDCVRFDGTSDHMDVPALNTTAGNWSVFMALEVDALKIQIFFDFGTGRLAFGQGTATNDWGYFDTAWQVGGTLATTPTLLTWLLDPTDESLRVDGVEDHVPSYTARALGGTAAFGSGYTGAAWWTGMDVYRLVIVDGRLSDEDAATIESCINTDWSLY